MRPVAFYSSMGNKVHMPHNPALFVPEPIVAGKAVVYRVQHYGSAWIKIYASYCVDSKRPLYTSATYILTHKFLLVIAWHRE